MVSWRQCVQVWEGALKLIDFGIAKAIESNDTTNIVRDNQVGCWSESVCLALLARHEALMVDTTYVMRLA